MDADRDPFDPYTPEQMKRIKSAPVTTVQGPVPLLAPRWDTLRSRFRCTATERTPDVWHAVYRVHDSECHVFVAQGSMKARPRYFRYVIASREASHTFKPFVAGTLLGRGWVAPSDVFAHVLDSLPWHAFHKGEAHTYVNSESVALPGRGHLRVVR